MDRWQRLALVGTLLLVACLLAGCGSLISGSNSRGLFGQGSIQRTIVGTSNEIIEGRSFHADAKDTIAVDYSVTVKEGWLSIWVRPAGLLGTAEDRLGTAHVKSSGSSQLKVVAPKSGNYQVIISPWGFGGDLSVSWEVR